MTSREETGRLPTRAEAALVEAEGASELDP